MNFIKNTLFFCSVAILSVSSLKAKSIEIILDKEKELSYNLNADILQDVDDPFAPSHKAPQYCKSLTIENIGDQPIRQFFPYIGFLPPLTIEILVRNLAFDQYPLLSLYSMWKNSLAQIEMDDDPNIHPLDLLNFRGVCSPNTFRKGFIKLCNAVGIETRLANVHGKETYDFLLDDHWSYFDFNHEQFIIGINNYHFCSSENIMDDPLQILRTKHSRRANHVDFFENSKLSACFDILNPASAQEIILGCGNSMNHSKAVTLFPGESLQFENSSARSDLSFYECAIKQTIKLKERNPDSLFKHFSFFPIQRIVNNTSATILIDGNVELSSGQTYEFQEPVFKLSVIFTKFKPDGDLILSGKCASSLFPKLEKGRNEIGLAAKKNNTVVLFRYEVDETLENKDYPRVMVDNQAKLFTNSPEFILKPSRNDITDIWWQIGIDKNFQNVPSSLDQVQPFASSITLSPIAETFLRPFQKYYFRVKGYRNGQWSDWSETFVFKVTKPRSIDTVLFEPIDDDLYELRWNYDIYKKDKEAEYLVFGSNSLDFIPSIYTDRQINAITNNCVTEEEPNDNLIAITKNCEIEIGGELAYYRIVARKNGQYSIPSELIWVYDTDLVQPRNVLQVVKDSDQFIAKRMLIPSNYPWSDSALPHITSINSYRDWIFHMSSMLHTMKPIKGKKKYDYEYPDVTDEIWNEVTPYLLPDNHPAWPKLNRVFCSSRATQTPEHFKKGGFRRWRPGRFSRVSASAHTSFREYFIKAYCDSEIGIIYDWEKMDPPY